jgi:hypothetical protein
LLAALGRVRFRLASLAPRMTAALRALTNQRRNGEGYSSFCTPNNIRVKNIGKPGNAATKFGREATHPMFSLGNPALGGSARRKI